jgi:beta-lactam-binding protein with PASTA domain
VAAAAGTPPTVAPPPGLAQPEERGFFTRNRLIVLGVLLALLLGVLAFALTRPAQVLVPTVIGKSQAQAESILRNAGFDVAVTSVPSDNPRGTVLEEDPTAGSRVDDGSTVTITVSSGLGTAVMPPVAGLPAKEALKTLRDRGLRVKQRNEFSNSVKRGLAIGTLPSEGQQVDRGTTVTLLVSEGPKLVTVPSVVGLQQDIAQSQLREAGLLPDVTQRNSDAPEGEVISQEPGPGSTVRRHSTVTIAISTGAGTAFVPNVIGDTQSGAKRSLKSQGLSVRIVERTTKDPNEDGVVVDQSPPAGTRLRRGEFVTIFVGRFTPPPTTTTSTTTTTGP